MTKDEINILSREIESISKNFETEPWTEKIKLLKDDFDINSIASPSRYIEFISEVSEILREARLLFLYSVLNKVCDKEGAAYHFKTPYQASMKYSAVMKKEGGFFILDEDGHYREISATENFTRFIDNEYWELIDEQQN